MFVFDSFTYGERTASISGVLKEVSNSYGESRMSMMKAA